MFLFAFPDKLQLTAMPSINAFWEIMTDRWFWGKI